MFFIPGVGYTNGQFVHDGIQYPKNWLAKADQAELDRLGAIRHPDYDAATQVVERDETVGWVVRDKTPQELAAQENARAQASAQTLAQAIHELWRRSWDEWGEAQIAAVDRTTIAGWAAGGVLDEQGMAMWREVIGWHDLVFSQHYAQAKAAIEAAGGWVEPDWESWPACPHGFHDFIAHRLPAGG